MESRESARTGEDRDGWRPTPRAVARSTAAAVAAFLAVALVAAAAATAEPERPADFAECDRKATVRIADFPVEVPAEGLLAAREALVEQVLTRIRKSFAGCGRTPGYDWIEVHGYAAEGDADAQQASERRAVAARDLLRARMVGPDAEVVRFDVAIGEGAADPVAPSEDDAGRAESRRVEIQLCRTFGPFHDHLAMISEAELASHARSEDAFEHAEMKTLHDQLLVWSTEPTQPATPFSRIIRRFWRVNGACRGEELLQRLDRVRRDYYDYHIRPHAYELGRLREAQASQDEMRRSKECTAARALLEAAERRPSMARIFRERVRDVFAVCL